MKSSDSQLKSRGNITIEDLQNYNNHKKTELLEMITSKEACKRTIAVKLLSASQDLNDDLIRLFLQTLTQEKKLYTKIEICEALSKFGLTNFSNESTLVPDSFPNPIIELSINAYLSWDVEYDENYHLHLGYYENNCDFKCVAFKRKTEDIMGCIL